MRSSALTDSPSPDDGAPKLGSIRPVLRFAAMPRHPRVTP
jgi:hypothetical protein